MESPLCLQSKHSAGFYPDSSSFWFYEAQKDETVTCRPEVKRIGNNRARSAQKRASKWNHSEHDRAHNAPLRQRFVWARYNHEPAREQTLRNNRPPASHFGWVYTISGDRFPRNNDSGVPWPPFHHPEIAIQSVDLNWDLEDQILLTLVIVRNRILKGRVERS